MRNALHEAANAVTEDKLKSIKFSKCLKERSHGL